MNAGADLVQTKIPDAISVPAKAVFTVNGKPAVYVKNHNRRGLAVKSSIKAGDGVYAKNHNRRLA